MLFMGDLHVIGQYTYDSTTWQQRIEVQVDCDILKQQTAPTAERLATVSVNGRILATIHRLPRHRFSDDHDNWARTIAEKGPIWTCSMVVIGSHKLRIARDWRSHCN